MEQITQRNKNFKQTKFSRQITMALKSKKLQKLIIHILKC